MIESTHAPAAPGWIDGVDRRLEVLSSAPLVLQTPVELLAGRRVTPSDVLFVRNCQDLDSALTMDPAPLSGWQIELQGLIRPARVVVDAQELLDMDVVEHEMVLQCSGNGRSQYDNIPGTPWGLGGVANVVFGGVPLAAVLERHGVEVDPQVRYVTAEGRDVAVKKDKPDFEHSVPVADVLDRAMIALTLNGDRLPAIHGGPVRLVVPGMFGTMQVKWLSRLRFETAESSNFYHATEYRVPHRPVSRDEEFRFTMENSRPTWNIVIMSYVLDPAPGAVLPPGRVTVNGVAYNDGAAPIDSVLVSFDRGGTWRPAQLDRPESPYAWYQWSAQADLDRGVHEVWSRAIDQLGRSQPSDGAVFWNPNGYEWNGMFTTQLTIT